MSEWPMGKFLEIDWSNDATNHSFVMDKKSEEAKHLTDDLQWWVCEKCKGRKLIKTIPADTTGPESRLIRARQPDSLTSVCPHGK